MTYLFGDLWRCWSIFRDLGSKGKILIGSRGNYFQGSGEINAIFSWIKGAQTPLGASTLRMLTVEWHKHHFIFLKAKNIYDTQNLLLFIVPPFLFSQFLNRMCYWSDPEGLECRNVVLRGGSKISGRMFICIKVCGVRFADLI